MQESGEPDVWKAVLKLSCTLFRNYDNYIIINVHILIGQAGLWHIDPSTKQVHNCFTQRHRYIEFCP